jgi:hypothetical protein
MATHKLSESVSQVRGNNLGGGVANNVQILTVRAVPGDEYDKDICFRYLLA